VNAATSFRSVSVPTPLGSVRCRIGGDGPAVLLLHGFPQTGLMWRDVAGRIPGHTVVVADLPGYGSSDYPPETRDHAAMSKRELAVTLLEMMRGLGHVRFAVVGHDRGGRVAYRLALDSPDAVAAVAVLDVVPTGDVWRLADARLALAFWPFSLLAQPAPLPERLIEAAPDAIVDAALEQWGTPPSVFPPEVRAAYIDALRDPGRVHAICEDYRAAADIDRRLDEQDLAAGRRIAAPVLALWSATGPVGTWYEEQGGPLGLWRRWAHDLRGAPVEGGHFFPEQHPEATAQRLTAFLDDVGA
jgi:haloacetate dehalogenase